MKNVKGLLSFLKQELVPALIVAGILLVVGLGLTILRRFLNDNGGVVQSIAVIVLVLVTGLYGWHTRQIAEKTKEQAEATQELAQQTVSQVQASIASVAEMQKQRYLASQPWVFPRLFNDEGYRVSVSDVTFVNIGNGPALELNPMLLEGNPEEIRDNWKRRTALDSQISSRSPSPFLREGSIIPFPWEGVIASWPIETQGVMAIEYKDIYGREFLSGWSFRIEREDDNLFLIPRDPMYPIERPNE